MTTTLTHDLTYDAPQADVHAMLMDPAFREQVCDAQRAVRRTVTIDGGTVEIDQTQPTQGVPGFAKKFVGEETNLVQTERWSGADGGTVEVEIPGKPGQMNGTIRLAESGGTTTETVEMQIKVSIPLVGGKLESLVSDLLRRALTIENEVGRQYLAR